MARLFWDSDANELRINLDGLSPLSIRTPVEISLLDYVAEAEGVPLIQQYKTGYENFEIQEAGDSLVARGNMTLPEIGVEVRDTWESHGDRLCLERTVLAEPGLPLRYDLRVNFTESPGIKYYLPGAITHPKQHKREGDYLFAEDRLAYPALGALSEASGQAMMVARENFALYDAPPQRTHGDVEFVRNTDLVSIGFSRSEAGKDLASGEVLLSWPPAERDLSNQLNQDGSAWASYHSRPQAVGHTARFVFEGQKAGTYADVVERVNRWVVDIADPQPTPPPVSLERSIDLRLDSASKTYVENSTGFAGFVLNFDPKNGYQSEAKAFGASFADHQMGGSRDFLEYGFTGRQLDIACSLAQRDPDEWAVRGARVVDSFVSRMCFDTGWVATIFDLATDEPVFAVGDRRGLVMHYLGESELTGTYLRMMVEAMGDLARNITLHRRLGRDVSEWENAIASFCAFLLSTQNEDGSWYRAYSPDGTPIVGTNWFGDEDRSGKSATAAVVPFLLAVAQLTPDADQVRRAAQRAGQYVRWATDSGSEYRGGTLDNPNDLDKEACFLAMRSNLAMYRETGESIWLESATRAAWFAHGWHSLRAVPNATGTEVDRAAVVSTGWGGINSTWGLGVTDIYSLFFATDLLELSAQTGIEHFARLAHLIAYSSLQILAVPEQLHGFVDAGMQPEGISFTCQGADEGLIQKGDTWGGLGWPYTAGTSALHSYLAKREELFKTQQGLSTQARKG